jgi:hypothetical protein
MASLLIKGYIICPIVLLKPPALQMYPGDGNSCMPVGQDIHLSL